MDAKRSLYGRWSRFSTIRAAASNARTANRFARCLCVAAAGAIALSACAPSGIAPVVRDAPTDAAPPTATSDEAAVVAYGIESGTRIVVEDDAWTVAARADAMPPAQAVALLLPAIASALQANDLAAAQLLIARAKVKPMREVERHRLQLHRAQLAQARGHHRRAVALLREIETKLIAMDERADVDSAAPAADLTAPAINLTAPDSTDDSPPAAAFDPVAARAEILRLLSDSQRALGRNREAALALSRRDALLPPVPRIANQRRLLALLDSLGAPGRALLRADTADAHLLGWLALSDALQHEPPQARDAALQQWRARHRRHPAAAQLRNRDLLDGRAAPARIALLLPLTSTFGHAAQAFYEGFMASRAQQDAPQRPRVTLHDIGDDPSLAALYYRAAINEGAGFVVGPLGRRAVGALLSGAPLALPTLLLGDVPAAHAAPDLYGLSLSPEDEARQAAARAFADGHRRAGVLRAESEWGQRVADAFAQEWEALGGRLAARVDFPRGKADHSPIIRAFLGLEDSVARERILSAQLDLNLQFTPRRRDDLDLLFIAADAAQARLMVPQLRFFQAHDLALYATSAVYAGKPDPAVDADLDGVIFGDLRWMIDAAAPSDAPAADAEDATPPPAHRESLRYAQFLAPDRLAQAAAARAQPQPPRDAAPASSANAPRAPSHRYHSALGRLYALGRDSYHLLPALAALRDDPQRRFFGDAADFSVQADGNALRHLAWARFDQGVPQPLPPREADAQP